MSSYQSRQNRQRGKYKYTRANIEAAIKSWPNNDDPKWKGLSLASIDGHVYLIDKKRRKLVAQEDVERIINQIFEETPMGRDSLFNRISSEYIGVSKLKVQDYLARREEWTRRRKRNTKGIQKPLFFSKPFERFQVDLTMLGKPDGPIPRANHGYKYIIVVIDWFSKFVVARPMKSKSAINTSRVMYEILHSLPRLPNSVQSDNGSEFGKEFTDMLRSHGIIHIKSRPYSPTSQGLVERFNDTMKTRLGTLMNMNHTKQWVQYLDQVIDSYNSTKHSVTGYTPYEVMNNPDIRMRVSKKLSDNAIGMESDDPISSRLPKIRIGDYVRIALQYETPSINRTQKRYKRATKYNWSQKIYRVDGISEQGYYRLVDPTDNRAIKERLLRRHIQRSVEPDRVIVSARPEVRNNTSSGNNNNNSNQPQIVVERPVSRRSRAPSRRLIESIV